ncbi:MAG: GNAT family N-acetyltransferase [Candidatus Bipolaricaulota bacterium]
MGLEVRRARVADKERIVAIASQIWDGGDYVPAVIDDWLACSRGELLVAEIDGTVAAFAQRTWLAAGHAWLQGIRADPALRGRGAGRALTQALVEACDRDGARRIGLSTYIDNLESIHLVESFGFVRRASFSYVEGTSEVPGAAPLGDIDVPSDAEFEAFVRASTFLRAARGRFPSEWRFLEFDWEPRVALGWAPHRFALRRDGRIVAALCASYPARADMQGAFLSFLEGSREDVAALLAHAVRQLEVPGWEAMIPAPDGDASPILATLRELGFTSWRDFTPDSFCYERDALSRPGTVRPG